MPITVPFPDPSVPIEQAIVELAACYSKNVLVQDALRRVNCANPDWTDLSALLTFAISVAVCEAKNPEEECCEADPLILAAIAVGGDAEIGGDLNVAGDVISNDDVTAESAVCLKGLAHERLEQFDSLLLMRDDCALTFPRTDLAYNALHLPGSLIAQGGATLATSLVIDGNATLDADIVVAGSIQANTMCCSGLPESDFTNDARLVFMKDGCIHQGPEGVCCYTVVGCCPPFTFDPDDYGLPGFFLPPGANIVCELPLYSADDNPSPPDPFFFCSQLITEGAFADSGYDPGITFGAIVTDGCPTLVITGYYNNDTATWSTTRPTFIPDGNVTFWMVNFYDIGYAVGYGSTDPGHEYLKPTYDGLIFDPDHRCPGDS